MKRTSNEEDPIPVGPTRHRKDLVAWAEKGPSRIKSIELFCVKPFSARGMKCLYGRGDHYPMSNSKIVQQVFGLGENARPMVCMMDMWLRKDGCVFARFYTRRRRVDKWWFEVRGLKLPAEWKRADFLSGKCVPEALRDRYEEWVNYCLCYPDG